MGETRESRDWERQQEALRKLRAARWAVEVIYNDPKNPYHEDAQLRELISWIGVVERKLA